MSLENRARRAAEECFHSPVTSMKPLGGGFYGRAFYAETARERAVVKLLLYPNLARGEAAQLKALARCGKAKVPEVYFSDDDAVVMEYVPGVNAGFLETIDERHRDQIAEELVDALIAWHDVKHPEGFGELDAAEFAADYRDFYLPFAQTAHRKARLLHDAGALGAREMRAFDRSMERFWDVFSLPIADARLIHGDFNTWNAILSEDLSRVRAVIDPFHCHWSDPEFDLYQLDNANGKQFGLHNLYAQRHALSGNYPVKRAFYELYTELNHFYDASVCLEHSNIPAQAATLERRMREAGIPV